jgi:hypothetical protein
MAEIASLDLKQFIRNIPDFPKPGILVSRYHAALGQPGGVSARRSPAVGVSVSHARASTTWWRPRRADFIFAAPAGARAQLRLHARSASRASSPSTRTPSTTSWSTAQDTLEMHVDGVLQGPERARGGRPPGHRRHRRRLLPSRRELRGQRRRVRLPDRVDGAQRPRKNRPPRGGEPDPVLISPDSLRRRRSQRRENRRDSSHCHSERFVAGLPVRIL